MKKNIWIILMFTIIIGCGEDGEEITIDKIFNARAWVKKIRGREFSPLYSWNIEVSFDSNGIIKNLYTGVGALGSIPDKHKTSIASVISDNKIIFKDYVKDVYGGVTNESTKYIGFELDDTETILFKTDVYDSIEDFEWNIKEVFFDESKLIDGLTEENWITDIEVGSIFITENSYPVIISWDWNEKLQAYRKTNNVETYGYLRIGDVGKIDMGVGYSWDKKSNPTNSSRDDTFNYAKNLGNIGLEHVMFEPMLTTKYYKKDNQYIYALCEENHYSTDGGGYTTSSYYIYSFKYDSKENVIDFMTGAYGDVGIGILPRNSKLTYAGKINKK